MRKRLYFKGILCLLFMSFSCNFSLKTQNAKAEEAVAHSKAECVIELESGAILHAKNSDTTLPMASTTKILTAITVLECCKDLAYEISIPQEAVGIEGSSVYLQQGEKYTILDLLYGLMLRSGNDCAIALALYVGGTVANFCAKMNYIAQKAGALNSNFENPHGLPNSKHYTTARDLSYITRYALKNKIFAQIVSTGYYEPQGWKNKNKMLASYGGCIGVKTGYTKQAGRCLVSAARRDGKTLICTVLNCPSMYERSAELLDKGFYRVNPRKILNNLEYNSENGCFFQGIYINYNRK